MRPMLIAVLLWLIVVMEPLVAGEDKPAAPKPPPVVSPEINADRSVTFRIKAPQAKEVSVRGQWAKDPLVMSKGEHDVWSATSAPIPAGVWEYSLAVDGVLMIDPGNSAIKPMREPHCSRSTVSATGASGS